MAWKEIILYKSCIELLININNPVAFFSDINTSFYIEH